MKNEKGPPTITASARLPDGRLAVMVGLRPPAIASLRAHHTAILAIPQPGREGPPLLLLIRVTEADNETFMAQAKAAFNDAADGELEAGPPIQIYPRP